MTDTKLELRDELKDAVKTIGSFTYIHHPFHVSLFGGSDFEIDFANNRFEVIKENIEAARREGDLFKILALTERPYRLETLLDETDQGVTSYADDEFIRAVAWCWVDSEAPGVNREVWTDLFLMCAAKPELLMTSDELRVLRGLDETVTLYRGARQDGLSWTLDRSVAEKFKGRRKGSQVVERSIRRDQALAYFAERDEQEIIVLEPFDWPG